MLKEKPGLYNECGDLIYTWKELIEKALIKIYEDELHKARINFGYKLIIDDNIFCIIDECFSNSNIKEITLGKNVEDITDCSFDDVSLKCINVHPDNAVFCSINGVLFNKSKTELIRYPEEKMGDTYIVPNTVTKIHDSGFYQAKHLKNIKIYNREIEINDHSFADIELLEEIVLPKNIKKIGHMAFANANDNLKIRYNGNLEELKNIKDAKNIFEWNTLKFSNIDIESQFTLEELIENGYNLRDANKILKNTEESMEK